MTGIDHQPLEIRLLYHRFQHFFPDALVSPATETPLDSIPLTIFRRQASPWCSRSQNPEHAIQKLTGILCVPSPRSLVSYCVRLENFPHRIGHIVPSIAVLHEETPLCVFLHYTTKQHFCRQCLVATRVDHIHMDIRIASALQRTVPPILHVDIRFLVQLTDGGGKELAVPESLGDILHTPDRYACLAQMSASSTLLSRRRYRSMMAVLKEIPLSLGTLRVTSPEVVVRLRCSGLCGNPDAARYARTGPLV